MRPDFRGALFNLALLLTEEQRSLEAVPYLETLLTHHPQHVKVRILIFFVTVLNAFFFFTLWLQFFCVDLDLSLSYPAYFFGEDGSWKVLKNACYDACFSVLRIRIRI